MCSLTAIHKFVRSFVESLNSILTSSAGDTADRQVPAPIRALDNVRVNKIECGRLHSAFLTDDGGLWTCGSGIYIC